MHRVGQQKWSAAAALLAGALLWALVGTYGHAQQLTLDKEAYLMPPKVIADAVMATRHENVLLTNLSPDGKKFIITKSDGPPTIQRISRYHVYLAEMAFDPVAGRAHQL